MSDARRLVCWLARDWPGFGLPGRPDLFPGNDHLTGKLCGNWLRLAGRHHKRPSWAAVWSPKRRDWRVAREAIDALLTLRGRPVDVAAIVPDDFIAAVPKRPAMARPAPIKGPAPRRRCPRAPAISAGRSAPSRHGGVGGEGLDLRRARAALEHYRNDELDYDDWLAIGMALRNLADEEAAFALWDDWSLQSGKYDQDATAAKWASLRPVDEGGGIGLGTLFRLAMDAGWPGPSFEVFQGGAGERRITHRSRRRGTIIVPAHDVKGTGQTGRTVPRGPAGEDFTHHPRSRPR